MMTCWVGVVGDFAKTGANVCVQSALVARQSDLKSDFDVI
jgi:hypothetical protein